jgi:hypothetical protein
LLAVKAPDRRYSWRGQLPTRANPFGASAIAPPLSSRKTVWPNAYHDEFRRKGTYREREAGFAAASLAQGQGNESLLKPRNLKPASCAFRRVGGQPQRAEVDQQRQAALTSIFFAGSVPPRSNGRDVARNRHQSRGTECRFLSSGYPNGRQTSSTSVGSSPAFYVAGNLVTFESLSFCSPQVTMAGVDAGRRTG